jgi:hypothetical protein
MAKKAILNPNGRGFRVVQLLVHQRNKLPSLFHLETVSFGRNRSILSAVLRVKRYQLVSSFLLPVFNLPAHGAVLIVLTDTTQQSSGRPPHQSALHMCRTVRYKTNLPAPPNYPYMETHTTAANTLPCVQNFMDISER